MRVMVGRRLAAQTAVLTGLITNFASGAGVHAQGELAGMPVREMSQCRRKRLSQSKTASQNEALYVGRVVGDWQRQPCSPSGMSCACMSWPCVLAA